MKVRRIWEKWHAGGADEDDFCMLYGHGVWRRSIWKDKLRRGGYRGGNLLVRKGQKGVEREDMSLGMLAEGWVEAEMWVDFISDRKAIKSIV